MSKKTSKAKSAEPLQKEDVVQAVVISDSFNSWFHPMSFSKPTPLLPLVNTPLVDYTLEFLALSGVQEVILFCCSHADLIKEHIRNSKWRESTSSMVVTIIVSESCRSLGDAMRDLDAKAVIRSDFILLSGSTVANVQLIPILEHHRKFAKQDKGAVMTLIYKEAGVGHKSRSPDDETILAVDSLTDRVLFHQKLGAGNKKVTFPLETFMDNSKVDILYNLQDTHISICSPAVPPLFSDNFDFQTRDDFVRGLLLNEEILASTIYWHRLEAAEYAACVTNWHMYQAISHDVIHRWAYPLVPDSSLSTLSEPYMYLRHNVYRQKTATLSKGCVLEEDVVIAEGTTVGENTCITRSVIGKGCKIGKNVTVSNSYLWDNVVVEDNCCIDFCVVAHGAVIKSDSKLSGGCILAPGVVLGPNKQMKAAWIVASPIVIKDDFSEEEKIEMENVGEKAYLYQPPVHDSDSEDEGKASQPSRLMLDSEGEEEGEEEEDESDDMSGSNELSYRASPVPDDTNMFFNEVVDSLTRGYEDKLHCENLILEINSSRYAYNVSVQEVNYHVVRALLSMTISSSSTQQFHQELHKRLTYFMPILKNYVRNEEAQNDCLHAIEMFLKAPAHVAAHRESYPDLPLPPQAILTRWGTWLNAAIFYCDNFEEVKSDTVNSKGELWDFLPKLLHMLYESDILEEDPIIEWYDNVDEASPTAPAIRKQVEPLIKWLREAASESSDSEDSESD